MTKKRGQRRKRLIERNFLTTEEKTEKFSFLYCEFYSEQKSSPKTSIVRKSIRKKQKVLREIFSAAKIAQKKQSVIIYISYTKRQTKSCTSWETGREGERADRRNTAFPKCRLLKGDAEPQVIIKCRKKLSIDARGGTIESFFLQKIKKIQKNAAVRKGRQYLLITGSRSQHLLPYSQTGRRFSPPEP